MNNWKKKFIIIWSGQLFSILSSSIAQFAIVLWISLETGSAEVLSFATIAALLPQVVLGPFAGVFVDRWSRKWTMILADSFVALCSSIIALLFYLDVIEIWQIYLLLMLRSVGSAFHAPAMKSSIPLLAPEKELTRIASINQTIQALCNSPTIFLRSCARCRIDCQYEYECSYVARRCGSSHSLYNTHVCIYP